MSTTDIIEAYEAGLITREEAAEQALVDTVDALYEKNAGSGGWTSRDAAGAPRGHAGH